MSAPSRPALTPGNRPGNVEAMHGVLGNLPTCAKAGLSCALLACTMGLALPAESTPQGLDLFSSTPAFAKSSNTSSSSKSYVKNGMFTFSASEYVDRVNDALKDLGQSNYSVNLTKGVDGKTLDMDIRYKSELVGFAEFSLSDVDDSWISYRERNSSKAFNQTFAVWFEDDDSAEYCFCVSLAMMMAADPALSKSDAVDFMSSLVDNFEPYNKNGKQYAVSEDRHNNIWYCLIINSDGAISLGIDCG